MPSLLDELFRERASQGRLPGAGELLRERARQTSLLSGADAPTQAPSIFNPRPGGATPGNLRQLQGAAELAGAPGPEAADPRQVQQATEGAANQMRQREAAGIARRIARVNNGELPPSSEGYIREVVNENEAGPGAPGRGFLGRLFAGERVPGLSDAQNKKIQNEAMLMAGLQLLGAGPNVNLGQALASGIMLARLQATNTSGELLDERKRQQRLTERYSVLSDTELSELERWQEIRRRSAAEGDLDAAEAAQGIIEDLKDRRQGEAERKPVTGALGLFHDGEGNLYDVDGNRIEADDPRLQPEQPQTTFERRSVPGVGVVEFELDPSGRVVNRQVVQGLPQEAAGGQVDPETEAIAAQLEREIDNIRGVLGDDPETEEIEGADRFGATGSFGRFARLLPAELEPSDLKQLKAATQNALSIIIKARSGAQASDKEVERLQQFATPLPGDDPETVRSKLERLEAIVGDFRRTGNANVAVDSIMQGGAQSEEDVIEEIYGGN